jgi:hypothetical protein
VLQSNTSGAVDPRGQVKVEAKVEVKARGWRLEGKAEGTEVRG